MRSPALLEIGNGAALAGDQMDEALSADEDDEATERLP